MITFLDDGEGMEPSKDFTNLNLYLKYNSIFIYVLKVKLWMLCSLESPIKRVLKLHKQINL